MAKSRARKFADLLDSSGKIKGDRTNATTMDDLKGLSTITSVDGTNDKVMIRDASTGEIKYATISNAALQGPAGTDGADGSDGTAATISVGTVTTGAEGSSVSVSNSGTSTAAVFDITIPTGATGATGADGATGPQGPAGADGAQGPQGPTGAAGATGPAGAAGAAGAKGAGESYFFTSSGSCTKSGLGDVYVQGCGGGGRSDNSGVRTGAGGASSGRGAFLDVPDGTVFTVTVGAGSSSNGGSSVITATYNGQTQRLTFGGGYRGYGANNPRWGLAGVNSKAGNKTVLMDIDAQAAQGQNGVGYGKTGYGSTNYYYGGDSLFGSGGKRRGNSNSATQSSTSSSSSYGYGAGGTGSSNGQPGCVLLLGV